VASTAAGQTIIPNNGYLQAAPGADPARVVSVGAGNVVAVGAGNLIPKGTSGLLALDTGGVRNIAGNVVAVGAGG
jgi:hypothetical protein